MLAYRVRGAGGGVVDADFHSAGPGEALLVLRQQGLGWEALEISPRPLVEFVGKPLLVADGGGAWEVRLVVAATGSTLALADGVQPLNPGSAVVDSDGTVVAVLRLRPGSARTAVGLDWLRGFDPRLGVAGRPTNIRVTSQYVLRLGGLPNADLVRPLVIGAAYELGLTLERRFSVAVGVGISGSSGVPKEEAIGVRTVGALYARVGPRLSNKQGPAGWMDLSLHPHALIGVRHAQDRPSATVREVGRDHVGPWLGGGVQVAILGILFGFEASVDPTDLDESVQVGLTMGVRTLGGRAPSARESP